MGAYSAVAALRQPRRGVQFFERNGRTHVRLTDRTPVFRGLAAVSAAAIVVYYSVKVMMGLEGPVPVAVLAWAFVVAVGLGAARWWRVRLDTGLYDLILDEQARILSLPAMHSHSTRRDIGWSSSRSVVMEKGSHQGRDSQSGSTGYFCCMLRIGDTADKGADVRPRWIIPATSHQP